MKRNLYGGLKISFGALLLLSGVALAFFKMIGRHFPDPLEWVWGTISYSVFFGTIRILVQLLFGAALIWAGQQDFKHRHR
jgi:hypothetical protein